MQRLLLVAGVFVLVALFGHGVRAQNVTEGFQSDNPLQKGMIVRLKKGDAKRVIPLTQDEVGEMYGVVVASSDAPVALSEIGADQEVFVATYGRYDVLVSDQNGPVQEGDYITVSSVAGVGMKANGALQLVIGKALKAFDGRTAVEGKTTLKTSGGDKTINLGRVPIEVSVAHNPLYEKENTAGVPKFLAKAAEVVTDRPVNAIRIYASLATLLVSLLVAGGILYAGVRSGITAIGRNPLAKHSIIRSLIQVTLVSLIVFIIGIFAVYLLLRI